LRSAGEKEKEEEGEEMKCPDERCGEISVNSHTHGGSHYYYYYDFL